MKKFFSVLLCLSMVASLMVAPASAAETGERTIQATYNERPGITSRTRPSWTSVLVLMLR